MKYKIIMPTLIVLTAISAIFLFPEKNLGATNRYLYLAHYEWDISEEWTPPKGAIGSLDLRTIPQMSAKGGTPQGYGLFVFDVPQTISGSILLGNIDDVLTNQEKTAIKNAFSLSVTPASATPRELLWDLLGKYSDPTGLTAPKPLMPDVNLNMDLHLSGFSIIKTEKFDINTHPNKDKVLAVLQESYREIRKTDPITSKKYLDVLEQQYKVSYKTFIPAGLPDEGKLPHGTTVTDHFTATNGTSLDAHTADTGGTWVEVIGDWSITSNTTNTAADAVFGTARHTGALSTSNMTAQITATAGTNGVNGALARESADVAPNEDEYVAWLDNTVASAINFRKVVNGTRTNLDASKAVTISLPDDIFISVNGSTMISQFNGVEKHNFTDTSITTGTFAGIYTRRAADIIDDFTASDITAPAAGVPVIRKGTLPVFFDSDI